jgi:Na+/proline symporter
MPPCLATALGLADYAVLAVYLGASILIGTLAGRKQGSLDEYCVVDLYRKYAPPRGEQHYVHMAQVFTALSGALVIGAAVWVSQARTGILQTIGALESKFVGPITGMFFLGVWTRRANLAGVVVGMVAALGVGLAMDWGPVAVRVNWMWTAPATCLVTFVIGYVASLAAAMAGPAPAARPPEPEPVRPVVSA